MTEMKSGCFHRHREADRVIRQTPAGSKLFRQPGLLIRLSGGYHGLSDRQQPLRGMRGMRI